MKKIASNLGRKTFLLALVLFVTHSSGMTPPPIQGYTPTKTILIYALVDPRNEEVRYVGKTEQKLESRITAHMRDTTKCHRVHWLNELKQEGLRPNGIVLACMEIYDGSDSDWWQLEEMYWIMRLKKLGANLTNNTIGGDGVRGLSGDGKRRMLLTWKGRKHSPETIEKLKAARKNRVFSEETRAKMSKAQKGRKILWVDAISNANRKISKETAEVIKLRIESGERVCDIAQEFNMHRTSISKIKMGTYFDRCTKPKKQSNQ